jgi:choline dehydrogenase-like flavoprotein
MTLDARSVPADALVDCDICIVGGGVAGLVLARQLIGHGARIILLESGGLEADSATQALYAGENVGLPYFPLDDARARYFGGSSHKWHIPLGGGRVGPRLRPLDPIDFEERDWVPHSGWPFGKSHLDPYYDRAQRVCQIEPPTFDPGEWDDQKARPQLRLASDEVETIIYKFGLRELFSQQYRNEVAQAGNVTTYLNANVLEIQTDHAAQSVTRLRAGSLDGHQFLVTARLFVLATGGIEVPRLLLLSNTVQKNGLGNQHDLVGRFFMEHLHFWSGVFFPRTPEIIRRMGLYNDIHTVNGVPIVGKLALTEKVLRREKLLNQNIQLFWQKMADPEKYPLIHSPGVLSFKEMCSALADFRLPTHPVDRLGQVLKEMPNIAAVAWRKVGRKIGAIPLLDGYVFANMTEQVPNPESRITLGPERDAFGQNRVRLDWKITPQDIASVVRTQAIIEKTFQGADLGRVYRPLRSEEPPGDLHGGYHHMGTTRMHVDPRKGVVDSNCRVHGISNLYIAGPSVFPTGGYANPVLTIVALSLRLGEHLEAVLN